MRPQGDRTLTDLTALRHNRKRAARSPMPTFLHDAAAAEISERVRDINRDFRRVAVVTAWPEIWKNKWKSADLLPDSDVIPFARASYDLVVHTMSLHWSNDPVGQLVQCRNVLKPDGLAIACLLGGDTLAELRSALISAELLLRGGASPRIAPMGSIRDLGGLLQRAGFALPVADRTRIDASYASAFELMHDLRSMGEANALSGRSYRFAPRRLFAEAASHYHAMHALPGERVPATFELIFLTGWAPSAGQQQPLKPGSADSRLADALSTFERKL